MYVERDGVEHIVTVATSFDWTWTDQDLPALCEALGWEVIGRTGMTATLRTDLVAAQSQAYWRRWDLGGMRHLIMVLTDKIDRSDTSAMTALLDEFDWLASLFTTILGATRDTRSGPEPQARWDRTNLVVRLFLLDGYINLYLVNPAYQEWLDTPDDFRAYE